MSTRREFISLLGGAPAAWPLAARAQGERERRIGVLVAYAESDPEAQARVAAFRKGLRELGWTEGHNLRVELGWGTGDPERARTFAAEANISEEGVPAVISGQAPLDATPVTSTLGHFRSWHKADVASRLPTCPLSA
jgi:hypothetical protein